MNSKLFDDLNEWDDAVPEIIDDKWHWVLKDSEGRPARKRRMTQQEKIKLFLFCQEGIARAKGEQSFSA